MPNFRKLLQQAQQERLNEWGLDTPEQLLGHCHENASFLATFLEARGIDCQIVYGAIDDPTNGKSPSSAEEAEKLGCVHFWVVAGDIHLDMVKETTGEIYVGRSLPANYTEFKRLPASYTPDDLLPSNL